MNDSLVGGYKSAVKGNCRGRRILQIAIRHPEQILNLGLSRPAAKNCFKVTLTPQEKYLWLLQDGCHERMTLLDLIPEFSWAIYGRIDLTIEHPLHRGKNRRDFPARQLTNEHNVDVTGRCFFAPCYRPIKKGNFHPLAEPFQLSPEGITHTHRFEYHSLQILERWMRLLGPVINSIPSRSLVNESSLNESSQAPLDQKQPLVGQISQFPLVKLPSRIEHKLAE